MTKAGDVLDGSPTEISPAVAWWSVYPTVLVYEQTIGASKYFAGRQVFESPNGSPTDSCFFADAALDGDSSYPLTGGGWYVGLYLFNHNSEHDYVGVLPGLIDYNRG